MERLTKREGKHAIRIGNEWRRNDPVWNRLAYCEDLLEKTHLLDYLVLTLDDDGTVTVIMSNKDYEE